MPLPTRLLNLQSFLYAMEAWSLNPQGFRLQHWHHYWTWSAFWVQVMLQSTTVTRFGQFTSQYKTISYHWTERGKMDCSTKVISDTRGLLQYEDNRHRENFSCFTGPKINFLQLFPILNMVISRTFIGPPTFFTGPFTFSSVEDWGLTSLADSEIIFLGAGIPIIKR